MKKYLLLIITMIIIPFKVNAGCSTEEITRLQKLSNNVNISYEYNEDNNTFTISFANLNGFLTVKDMSTNRDYYTYDELRISNVNSGSHTYYIYASNKNCYESELGVKTIILPYYNKYYNYDKCKNIREYRYCSKWLKNNISQKEWENNVDTYIANKKAQEEEKRKKNQQSSTDKIRQMIFDMYVKYYYIILPVIIGILGIIIYVKNKTDQIYN